MKIPTSSYIEVDRVRDITPNDRAKMSELFLYDVDSGRVDSDLDNAIASYDLWAKFTNYTTETDTITDGLRTNMYLYSKHMEYGKPMNELVDTLNQNERKKTFGLLSSLISRAPRVGELFPDEMQQAVMEAYGESVTSVVYTLAALKRGEKIPTSLPLGHNGEISLGKYSYESALSTLESLQSSLDTIWYNVTENHVPVSRVNKSGSFGMYRLGNKANVLATVRLLARTSYDPAIEYANRNGTQASIGYSVEEDGGYISAFKEHHRSTFSIRVDNEGDVVALDIGSILGRKGTLGKRVADLIAIGDMYRSDATGKTKSLNHNSGRFQHTRFEIPETFAKFAAETAIKFERRSSSGIVSRALLAQTIAS